MSQIELLESELELLKDNISRLKTYKKEYSKAGHRPYSSLVLGEFKHRLIALKQRCTLIQNISTHDFLKN